MAENPHKNHRKRLRRELIEQDFPDSTPDHKILEALLFYGVPQKDTNPLAHELINTFGSLSAVFDAHANSLFEVKGMTERAVTLIKMILPLSRRYNAQKRNKTQGFESLEQLGDFLKERHLEYGNEVFMVTCLDEKCNLIACDVLNKGDSLTVNFAVKDVVQVALKHNTPFVVISHNHLTGNAIPSKADIVATQNLIYTLKQMNIKLLDHFIIAGNDYVSMASSKDLPITF